VSALFLIRHRVYRVLYMLYVREKESRVAPRSFYTRRGAARVKLTLTKRTKVTFRAFSIMKDLPRVDSCECVRMYVDASLQIPTQQAAALRLLCFKEAQKRRFF
jgi:hypothetical protein